MANDGSLVDGALQPAFDMDTQSGVTTLLASIRSSELSTQQKNELRDLVFLYTNGGRDQSVRITLEQKITGYGIVPVAKSPQPASSQDVAVEQIKHTIGASRVTPSFSVSKNFEPKSPPTVEEQKSASTVAPPPSEPVPVVEPTLTQPSPVATPSDSVVPEPASVPAQAIPVAPPPADPKPVEESSVVSDQSEAVLFDLEQSLERIREIKSIVNDKVGNPVNLVDINNEVGREYMGALLDAMKKLNDGTSALSAMKRLETAFLMVQKTIAEHQENINAGPEPEPTPQPQPVSRPAERISVSAPAPAPVSPPVRLDPVPEVDSQTARAKDGTTQYAEGMTPPVANEVIYEDIVVSDETENVGQKNPIPRPVKPSPQNRVDTTVANSTEPLYKKEARGEIKGGLSSAWGPATDTLNTPPVTENAPIGKATPLARDKVKLRTLNDLPSPSSLETSSQAGDPLFTKEIDDGLDQLLLEWSLFKKSGLFGSGPKGREHPLFKKMAGLQIPLLLAGRFEGATQEIRQSVTDYMNGWRYEQGISYNQGENFEHYLRRVISHILGLKKK